MKQTNEQISNLKAPPIYLANIYDSLNEKKQHLVT